MHINQAMDRRAVTARSRRRPLSLDTQASKPTANGPRKDRFETEASASEPPLPAADWLQRAEQVPGLRLDKVRAIRAALAAGTYDLDSKMDHFLTRFQQQLPAMAD